MPEPRLWNSLEICKLIAAVTTPVVVFILGWVIWHEQHHAVQRWEVRQQEQRALVESELKERDRLRDFHLRHYEKTAVLLNDIVAYHFYVGRWKEWSPATIIEKKNQLDEAMHPHRALFSTEFFGLFRAFMRQSFRSAGNHYGESRIRTQAQCRHPSPKDQPERWLTFFTHEDRRRELCIAYINLLGGLSNELRLPSLKKANPTDDEKIDMCPPLYEAERWQ